MEELLAQLHQWMADYMKSFYNEDEKIQAAILLKEEHTGYVTEISRELAAHLRLNPHDRQLAELMGLFHDIGRFRQFTLYQTFIDAQSDRKILQQTACIVDIPVTIGGFRQSSTGKHQPEGMAGCSIQRQ